MGGSEWRKRINEHDNSLKDEAKADDRTLVAVDECGESVNESTPSMICGTYTHPIRTSVSVRHGGGEESHASERRRLRRQLAASGCFK